MLVIPAIDLRGGKCVRLYQGDFSKETVFSYDPVSVAERWVRQGASVLHVVDLDGAKAGAPQNLDTVRSIISVTGAAVQLGGGLRSRADIDMAFRAGVKKAAIGTALFSVPGLLEWVTKTHRDRVFAALDCREGVLMIRGWAASTGISVTEAASRLIDAGLSDFIYTDVSRDGAMSGPDVDGIGRLLDMGAGVIAAGGVSSLEDVCSLSSLADRGLKGIIIGRALYDGAFMLSEAIEAVRVARSSAGHERQTRFPLERGD